MNLPHGRWTGRQVAAQYLGNEEKAALGIPASREITKVFQEKVRPDDSDLQIARRELNLPLVKVWTGNLSAGFLSLVLKIWHGQFPVEGTPTREEKLYLFTAFPVA